MAKILQVCNSDFYLAKFLLPLVRRLVEEGHAVECVCEGAALPGELRELGVVVHPFVFPRRISPRAFCAKIAEMRRLVRAGRYDCVVSHNRGASVIGRIAAWLERVPLKVYTAHGFYFHDDQGALAREATIWVEVLLGRLTDYTLSQSSADVELAVRRGIAPRARIEHIGNGIDTARFTPRGGRERLERQLGLRSGAFRVCSTGRLVRGKGFVDLLEAFARFRAEAPDAELVLIGGNIGQDIEPFQKQFLERVGELGLGGVVSVTGITDRVEDYLETCDLFVLPSYREGVPRSLIEAMSMGIPSIATEIRGCREIIVHGQNGFLFRPKDVVGLAALMGLLHRDAGLRSKLGRNGRATAVASYDQKRYVEVQVTALARLLGGAGRPA